MKQYELSFTDNLVYYCRRALKIIDEYFLQIVIEQDFLGNDGHLNKFLLLVNESVRSGCEEVMKRYNSSEQRWNAFSNYVSSIQRVSFMTIIIY